MKTSLFIIGAGVLATAAFSPGPKTSPPTFSDTIKPLIDTKCVSCHQKGGAAPFPLQTYAQVKKRADLCVRMMLTRMMPPCNAKWDGGEFCLGGGPLTDEEAVLLQQWVHAGAPEGAPSVAIPVRDRADWTLGEPDVVLEPAAFTIPEEGRPFWRAVVIPLGKSAGRRITGFEVKVDQPEALRSMVLAVARDGLLQTRRAKESFLTGGSLDHDAKKHLGTWADGYPAWRLPKGVAMTLDGDAIVVQALYLPRGKSESGGFRIGLHFSENPTDREPQWMTIQDEDFAVPAPGSLVLTPKGRLPDRSSLLAVIPEARFFCTSIRLVTGDRTLFSTRRWEPYWQGVYRYPEPIAVPDGAELTAEFNFDNDIHMGRNEGRRPRPILPGYRERDELCRIHLLYVRGPFVN